LFPENVDHCFSFHGIAKYRRIRKTKYRSWRKFDIKGKPEILGTAIGKPVTSEGLLYFKAVHRNRMKEMAYILSRKSYVFSVFSTLIEL
jgi:hypothetical protein